VGWGEREKRKREEGKEEGNTFRSGDIVFTLWEIEGVAVA
jgi:hypothetical protein